MLLGAMGTNPQWQGECWQNQLRCHENRWEQMNKSDFVHAWVKVEHEA